MMSTMTLTQVRQEPVGEQVRRWRERRRRSQLDVSIAADLSTRHLSFIETGRATPSRSMIARICEELEVPLRERNVLYLAAGFAPVHTERGYEDLGQARSAVEAVLRGSNPNPAMAVDTLWQLVAMNDAARGFFAGVTGATVVADRSINVLRATLHPEGLASRIRNYVQWRAHVVRRVRRQWERTAIPELLDLLAEVEGYPVPEGAEEVPEGPVNDFVTPMRVRTDFGEISLLYALTLFGAPRDVTLDEIAIETFFPADQATADLLAGLAHS
jgi:transcriptional regulator with XRE-family HTH domain